MKIMKFSQRTCGDLRIALENALSDIGIEGVTVSVGRIGYTDNEAKVSIVAKTEGHAAEKALDVGRIASMFGLRTTENDKWKIVEYKRTNRTYPFICVKKMTGGRFKLSVEQAQLTFGRVE